MAKIIGWCPHLCGLLVHPRTVLEILDPSMNRANASITHLPFVVILFIHLHFLNEIYIYIYEINEDLVFESCVMLNERNGAF